MTSKRLRGVQLHKAICYGSQAFPLPKKEQDQYKTHKWSVYLRGYDEPDISYFVKKVQFSLHPTFPNPKRIITKPPFQIDEVGWGEFAITLRIFFVDDAERPLDVVHNLKLHPAEETPQSMKQPVVSEAYDEIVFTEPTESFHAVLTNPPAKPTFTPDPRLAENYLKFNEQAELETLRTTLHSVNRLAQAQRDLLKDTTAKVEALKSGLAEAGVK